MEGKEIMRFSSCRGVSFEINQEKTSCPFEAKSRVEDIAPDDERWVSWRRWNSGRDSFRVFPLSGRAVARSTSRASSHFCDLEDDNEEEDEEKEIEGHIKDLEKQLSVKREKKVKKSSRISVILLDQGLFTVYKRLFLVSLTLNALALALAVTGHFPYAKPKAALFSMGNILALTLCRSEAFLRLVFCVAVKILHHSCIPLRLKTAATSFLQSLGGIHSGCAVSSIAWLLYALILTLKNRDDTSTEIIAVASAILALLCLSSLAAFPLVRHLHHNAFERTHRFVGWTALTFLWFFIVLTVSYEPRTKSYDFHGPKLAKKQEFWFTLAITLLTILPWLTVRRVPVTVTAPSTHASLIKFAGGIRPGILGRISRSPLFEWHAFGIISDGKKEHIVLAGAVGDFTKGLVSDPPSHLWVRTVHFAGLPYLVNMYKRVVLVATGSGICVFLSFLLQPTATEVCVVWVTKGVEENFGKEIREMMSGFPKEKVIVHDTAVLGRPNVAEMSVEAAKRWRAEVVVVTSNPEGSRDVVRACKGAGIAAFGPIWDS